MSSNNNDQYRTPPTGTTTQHTAAHTTHTTSRRVAPAGGASSHQFQTPPAAGGAPPAMMAAAATSAHQNHHQQQQQQHNNAAHFQNQIEFRLGELLDDADHKRCSEGNQRALLAEKLDTLRQLSHDLEEDEWMFVAPKQKKNTTTTHCYLNPTNTSSINSTNADNNTMSHINRRTVTRTSYTMSGPF